MVESGVSREHVPSHLSTVDSHALALVIGTVLLVSWFAKRVYKFTLCAKKILVSMCYHVTPFLFFSNSTIGGA
jgi:hypothetical protein